MDKEYLILFSILIYFILGLFVYFKNKKSIINRSFFLFTFTVSIWAAALFFYTHPILIGPLGWIKITYFLSFFPVSAFFYFSSVFSGKDPATLSKPILIYWIVSILFIFTIFFTDFFIQGVQLKPWGYDTINGPAYPFYGIFVLFYVIQGIISLHKKLKKSEGVEALQLKYILIGVYLFGFFTILPDIILPIFLGTSEYFWTSPLASFFFIVFTTLAIIRYHLFEVKIILTELLVGAMGIVLLIQIFLAPTSGWRISSLVIFSLFCIFGYLLIKYSHQEEKTKEQLQKSYQELKNLDQSKTEFLSIASHQLRTPLTAIRGYASMLKEGVYGAIPEKAQKAIDYIHQSAIRMIGLVNGLLNVSRLQTGKIELRLEDVSIEPIIQDAIEEVKLMAQEKNLFLNLEKPTQPLPLIKADKEKLKEVIVNLLDNAIRYTDRGGVTINLRSQNSNLKIKISDTGQGMGKDDIDKLFKSFSRGQAGLSTHTQGSGLGLYTAKKFIELHNGRIWAESEGKNKGSIFYIELPITQNQH